MQKSKGERDVKSPDTDNSNVNTCVRQVKTGTGIGGRAGAGQRRQ